MTAPDPTTDQPRPLTLDEAVAAVDHLGLRLKRAREAEARAFNNVRDAVLEAIKAGATEKGMAELAGVDRMTVRDWQGKRRR